MVARADYGNGDDEWRRMARVTAMVDDESAWRRGVRGLRRRWTMVERADYGSGGGEWRRGVVVVLAVVVDDGGTGGRQGW